MMRAALSLGLIAFTAGSSIREAEARAGRGWSGGIISVRGYTTPRGTYVAPYTRSRAGSDAARPAQSSKEALVVGSSTAIVGAGVGIGLRSADAAELDASTPPQHPVEVAQAAAQEAPWCAPSRIVGSGLGFCLVN